MELTALRRRLGAARSASRCSPRARRARWVGYHVTLSQTTLRFAGIAVGTAAAPHIVGLDMYATTPRFDGALADVRSDAGRAAGALADR